MDTTTAATTTTISYYQKRNLRMHKKVAHGPGGGGKFVCKFENCRKAFQYKHVLDRHMHKCHEDDGTLKVYKKLSLAEKLKGVSKEVCYIVKEI